MKEKFVIVSIRHTDSDGIMYWRENNSGYTYSPFEAGQYDAAKVIASLDYYFDYGNIPIPIRALDLIKLSGITNGKLNITKDVRMKVMDYIRAIKSN